MPRTDREEGEQTTSEEGGEASERPAGTHRSSFSGAEEVSAPLPPGGSGG